MNFKRTQTWPGKTPFLILQSAWGPKSLCIYINQCIVNFNWPMSCARAFLRNNWLPHFRLLLSSPSLSIQNMMTRAMIHPHFKIDEKWILTFLYIYRWKENTATEGGRSWGTAQPAEDERLGSRRKVGSPTYGILSRIHVLSRFKNAFVEISTKGFLLS